MKVLWPVFFLFLASCGGGFGDELETATSGYYYGGYCEVRNADTSVEVCVDFNSNNPGANTTQCSTVEMARYAPGGSQVWQGGLPYDVCAQQNPSLLKIGSCALSDRTVRYYSQHWTSATAQTDCSGRSGTWSVLN